MGQEKVWPIVVYEARVLGLQPVAHLRGFWMVVERTCGFEASQV